MNRPRPVFRTTKSQHDAGLPAREDRPEDHPEILDRIHFVKVEHDIGEVDGGRTLFGHRVYHAGRWYYFEQPRRLEVPAGWLSGGEWDDPLRKHTWSRDCWGCGKLRTLLERGSTGEEARPAPDTGWTVGLPGVHFRRRREKEPREYRDPAQDGFTVGLPGVHFRKRKESG